MLASYGTGAILAAANHPVVVDILGGLVLAASAGFALIPSLWRRSER
jgi:hypothetical protein